ncbi:MAG: hypothetical protein V1679_01915, partial [Candidatus Peregrinibacteria bacterium]
MRLHKTKSQNGFISIIALGIFAVLMIYGIIISKSTINTIESVKNTNKYYAARDTADSVMEYLQYELNSREAGFNLSGGCLEDGTPKTNTVDANIMDSETCRQFYENLHLTDKNVKITAEIKGRSSAEAGEYFTDCPGMEATQCYVVPFPGTGDAGEKCSLYTPHFGQGTKTNRIDDNGQLVTNTTTLHSVPEVDYSCNWSKLSFGSSITDRVAIPLYYDDGMGSIISPFNSDTPINKRATEFVLRLRTPCEPFTGTQIPNDKTICADTGRFDLDDDPKDDIVVQW